MLLQKTRKHEAAAEAHNRESERKINEDGPAKSYGKKNHGNRHQDACHLQAYQSSFRCPSQTHVCARHQRGADCGSCDEPGVHCLAPRAFVMSGTLLLLIWWKSMRD